MPHESNGSSCPLSALARLLSRPRSRTPATIPGPNGQESEDRAAGLNVRIHVQGPGALGHGGVVLGRLAAGGGDAARPGAGATLTKLETGFIPGELVFEIHCTLGRTTCPALHSASVSPSVFRKEGDYWTISYRGTVMRMKHGKGLYDLDQLLHNPDRHFHVLDLMRLGTPYPAEEGADPARVRQGGGSSASLPRRLDPVLDTKARQAYRRRLTDLRETLQEAERFCDAARAERARAEVDFLTHQLSAAVGLHGRDRATGVPAERARVAVTLRIRAAVCRIRELHPDLGLHLGTSIRTGYFCRYSPSPDNPIRWST